MRVESLAVFAVYTIFPKTKSAPSYGTMDHLAILLQAIEGFFHPSNFGTWTPSLSRFIQTLSFNFLERIRIESRQDSKIPQELRIDDDIKNRFVLLLRPLVYVAMFGKDQMSIMMIHGALKNLSWIAPQLIFPGLLDRIYPSLETLSEVKNL